MNNTTFLNNTNDELEKIIIEKKIITFDRKLTRKEMLTALSFENEKFKITGIGEGSELHNLAFNSKFYKDNQHVCHNRDLYDIPDWCIYSPSALIEKLNGGRWIDSDSGGWASGDEEIRQTLFVTLDIKDGYKSHNYNKK